ncbi:RNA polymerase sigma24 factor [Actinomadura rubrobrunea]|uniref:RNA polymerase sigma24 factor n=1 Tax=Actinomadura rubrobrunea TaxID=115335 RepID=A0A9W6Q044_9ACTN|nr:RNA polymerase sigma factor SigJ [Actinomadura rubrobrunea]GLW67529.1 RNA polymerase sigma24 factor [Actinomadura rubrobrunea]
MSVVTEPDTVPVANFEKHRPLLLGVAYRVLGSVVDAEDVLQEAWLRWSRVDHAGVTDPQSYLVQVVTRLSLDRLRQAKARREAYVGPWLPEPIPTGPALDESAELADSVSMAMLVVMETLSPLERVVFVLREAFEFSFADIAAMLDRSESAVRQLARRARSHVRERRPRFRHDRAVRRKVTERFLAACLGADIGGLVELLAPDVTLWSDGNGRPGAPRVPVRGARKVGGLLVQGVRKLLAPRSAGEAADATGTIVDVNGGPAVLFTEGGSPTAVMVLDIDAATDRVADVWLIANPDKLAAVDGLR